MTITHERESFRTIDIVVAEDSPTQAQYLARLLGTEAGWRVHLVADGVAALARIRAAPPDLVISDIAMPGMDGHTLCRTLKDDPLLAGIPVLLLTSLASLHDIVRGMEAGADAFVRKPFDPEGLRARVRRILAQRAGGVPAGAGRDGPLEFMADERRQIHDLLLATHESALRLNAELDAQRAGLAHMCDSLALLGEIVGALNEAVSEDSVAHAALDHLLRLPALAGARLSVVAADGALRELAARGAFDAVARTDLVLPLAAGGRRLGMLALRVDDAGLQEGERNLVANIAAQIALALERARLYARAEALVVERTAALQSERNRLSAIVATTGALILVTDPAGRIVMFNRACEDALGWRAAEAIGRRCWDVVRGADDPDISRRLFAELGAQTQAQHVQQVQGTWRTADGTVRDIIWTSTLIRHPDGSIEYVLGTGIDVTELRGAEARLRYVSNYDTHTGLPNRAMLRDRMAQMQEQARANGDLLGFMILRFGRMPLIRQALGPDAEQALLRQAAGRLRGACGAAAPARFSEDAFALALACPDAAGMAASARRLLGALGARYEYEQEEFRLDPCLGIAVYPTDGTAYETLVKGAEAALRQACDSVGQRYAFYRPEFNEGANDRFKLESALHRALERGELELHYQPQVTLDGGTLVSAEALVRWRHPERGMVPPAAFIPLAEECSLILPLGEWVLRQACRQLCAWQKAGLPLVPVGVNLSALQFSDHIVPTVRRILDEYGVDPALLELELTETASMADPVKTCELMVQLRAMGIRLAIDDFGTGYSNLTYLKRFPVDKLKLDGSFVRDLESDPDDLAIARAVVAMAHGLRLRVVAEGVETPGQLALLAELGCDQVQGFLFSRAVPADAFAALLSAGRVIPSA